MNTGLHLAGCLAAGLHLAEAELGSTGPRP